MKYILVTGGVISGIGKGVIASSIGTILKASGVRVTSIKIDPYINIDAGTFSPSEHGEVFVLDDGGEVDLDLGNYERFMDVTLRRDNNITTGKVYQNVIAKERAGDYLGKTVQVIPHITDHIMNWVERVAHIPVDGTDIEPDCCIIELGGTIGDIEGMPFVEAFRQLQFKVKRENFSCVHVSLVPEPETTGEQKTKPTQMSVRQLGGLGIPPDLIMCRTKSELTKSVRNKLSVFCNVEQDQIFSVNDVNSIYRVPLLLEEQNITQYFAKHLHLPHLSPRPKRFLTKWKDLADRHDGLTKEVSIAFVGKYVGFEDAYASVKKALNHAAMAAGRKLKIIYIKSEHLEKTWQETDQGEYHEAWKNLCISNGLLVPGGFGIRGMQGKMLAIEWARNNKKPFLGVCLGLQCAVIEFARNVLHLEDADTTEARPSTTNPVVIEMPEHNPGMMGGTMRLGKRKTLFVNKQPSVIRQLYGNPQSIDERHRHRYEVNPELKDKFEDKGLRFVGQDETGKRMEIVELQDHPYFVGVQYHPEYLSRPMKPSPPYLGLIYASCGKLQSFLSRGCRHTPLSYIATTDDEYDQDSDSSEISKITSVSTDS